MEQRGSTIRPLAGGTLRFLCHKEVSCFNKCCADLQLMLTPYDILRIKRTLKLSSDEFLNKYTLPVMGNGSIFPMVRLKMRNDKRKSCPFVSDEGCAIYMDRPGSCRLYPLGRAASVRFPYGGDQEFYFLVNEPHCLGFMEKRQWTAEEWIKDQGVDIYNKMNGYWMEIVTSRNPRKKELSREKLQMFYMTSYNLDRFRDFVFQSKFLKTFDIVAEEIERIKTDETELIKFGMKWLKFALFGESTFRLSSPPPP